MQDNYIFISMKFNVNNVIHNYLLQEILTNL